MLFDILQKSKKEFYIERFDITDNFLEEIGSFEKKIIDSYPIIHVSGTVQIKIPFIKKEWIGSDKEIEFYYDEKRPFSFHVSYEVKPNTEIILRKRYNGVHDLYFYPITNKKFPKDDQFRYIFDEHDDDKKEEIFKNLIDTDDTNNISHSEQLIIQNGNEKTSFYESLGNEILDYLKNKYQLELKEESYDYKNDNNRIFCKRGYGTYFDWNK